MSRSKRKEDTDMKKNYQTPIATELNLEMEELLQISANGTTDQTEGNLSRHSDQDSDLWEDDWEE